MKEKLQIFSSTETIEVVSIEKKKVDHADFSKSYILARIFFFKNSRVNRVREIARPLLVQTSLPSTVSSWKLLPMRGGGTQTADFFGFGGGTGRTFGFGRVFGGTFFAGA